MANQTTQNYNPSMSADLTGDRRRYHPDPTTFAAAKCQTSSNYQTAAVRSKTTTPSVVAKSDKHKSSKGKEHQPDPTHVRLEFRASQQPASAEPRPVEPNSMSNIGKPARGWLHPDHLLAKEGINYSVRVSQNIATNYVNEQW